HLLVDIVLTKPLGEGSELALDVLGPLSLQSRRTELAGARTMAGRARRNAACGVAGKCQSGRHVRFAERMTASKGLAEDRRKAVGATREVSRHVGRIFRRQWHR